MPFQAAARGWRPGRLTGSSAPSEIMTVTSSPAHLSVRQRARACKQQGAADSTGSGVKVAAGQQHHCSHIHPMHPHSQAPTHPVDAAVEGRPTLTRRHVRLIKVRGADVGERRQLLCILAGCLLSLQRRRQYVHTAAVVCCRRRHRGVCSSRGALSRCHTCAEASLLAGAGTVDCGGTAAAGAQTAAGCTCCAPDTGLFEAAVS